jgi:hypothetical protein
MSVALSIASSSSSPAFSSPSVDAATLRRGRGGAAA